MRIAEADVARILQQIANAKARPTPKRKDLEGDYDAWFDGGAIRYVTGTTEYHFADGAFAGVAITSGILSVVIRLPDGRVASVVQQASGDDRPRE